MNTSCQVSWLNKLTREQIEKNNWFPLDMLLQNSLYYPACYLDGGPVKLCNRLRRDLDIVSFIYCDYLMQEEEFLNVRDNFTGYHIIGSRRIQLYYRFPIRRPIPSSLMESFPSQRQLDTPYAYWIVYERDSDRGDMHGPFRFSMLYIAREAVITYQDLYWANRAAPRVMAIICPGTGFGGNWTDFDHKDKAMSWVVNNNPAGIPDLMFRETGLDQFEDYQWDSYEPGDIIPYYHPRIHRIRLYIKRTDDLYISPKRIGLNAAHWTSRRAQLFSTRGVQASTGIYPQGVQEDYGQIMDMFRNSSELNRS